MSVPSHTDLGLVAIGRNEGERLKRCLRAAAAQRIALVYVDSGSTDGSAEWAADFGAELVRLDMSIPFTAARARNAGLDRLLALNPQTQWVQFIDGDCELLPGWLESAWAFLAAHPEVAAVSGRLNERRPEASVYNRLCDIEWDVPVGEVRACGGNAMMRTHALVEVGGFNAGLIAGEEPELCVRFRQGGWKIWHVADPMALHDANILRFGQWWQRTRRSGFAFAQGMAIHGTSPERHYVAETRRAVIWGIVLPLLVVAGSVAHPLAALAGLAFPMQILRLGVVRAVRGERAPWTQAVFLVVGRFPEAQGVVQYLWARWRKGPARLIEYK